MEDDGGLDRLEIVVRNACSLQDQWPARVAAGIYAGIDFVVAQAEAGGSVCLEFGAETTATVRYGREIARFAATLESVAPVDARLPATKSTFLAGGIIDLVGTQLRLGGPDRLLASRRELVLLVLLFYLDFAEAKSWADRIDSDGLV
jgi:hypothetical protein